MSLRTAGAFILVDGLVAFQAGPDQTGEQIGIVRIGGHIEPGESPWESAQREALEDASLRITPIEATVTYCLSLEEPPCPIDWTAGAPRPVHASATSRVFLGTSGDPPVPKSETQGLILLPPQSLLTISSEQHTLASLEESGCRVILRDDSERDSLFAMPVAARWAGLLGEVMALHRDLSLWEA